MYEAHQKYIDVHYIIEGVERIATADVSSLQIQTPFSEEKRYRVLSRGCIR